AHRRPLTLFCIARDALRSIRPLATLSRAASRSVATSRCVPRKLPSYSNGLASTTDLTARSLSNAASARAPTQRSNNSFKPNLLRYTNNMAGKACHVVGYATQVGLTQALGPA